MDDLRARIIIADQVVVVARIGRGQAGQGGIDRHAQGLQGAGRIGQAGFVGVLGRVHQQRAREAGDRAGGQVRPDGKASAQH